MQSRVNFDTLAGGEAGEQFQRGYEEILQNILNPNTDPKKKRKLVIELVFEPDENRDLANVTIQVTPKLVPSIHSFTRILIGKDGATGQVIAKEFFQEQVAGMKELVTATNQDVFK